MHQKLIIVLLTLKIRNNNSLSSQMLWRNLPMRTLQEQELLKYPWRTGFTEQPNKKIIIKYK